MLLSATQGRDTNDPVFFLLEGVPLDESWSPLDFLPLSNQGIWTRYFPVLEYFDFYLFFHPGSLGKETGEVLFTLN